MPLYLQIWFNDCNIGFQEKSLTFKLFQRQNIEGQFCFYKTEYKLLAVSESFEDLWLLLKKRGTGELIPFCKDIYLLFFTLNYLLIICPN